MDWIRIGALWGFLAVSAGAFGAHGLEGRVDAQALAWWETAALYHLVHALALVAFGTLRRVTPGVAATVEFVATDGCGAWPTFVGGGPAAF